MRKIIIAIVPCILFSQNADTIFGAKLNGIEVQKFSPGIPCKFDSFKVIQSGEWVILRGYATITSGIASGDIIAGKLKGFELDSANVSSSVFFNGFSAAGPDANGYITLSITRTNGTQKDILRTNLLGTKADGFSIPTSQIDSFYTTGPDVNGYVWLLVGISQPLGEHEKPPQKGYDKFNVVLDYALKGIFPNPAREFTRISYSIAEGEHVRIYIYDKSGKIMSKVVDEFQPMGVYRVFWGLVDDREKPLPDGEYFIRMKAGDFEKTEKILILR